MNIFTVLSQGNGRLDEENISAMLGFLLNPNNSHGLGDLFLREFLKLISDLSGNNRFNDILKSNSIKAEILLERQYEIKSKNRTIDIEIKIYPENSKSGKKGNDFHEIHRIAIENKIKSSSAEVEQFKEEFLAINEDLDDGVELTMVFLTPFGNHNKLNQEYDKLDNKTLKSNIKVWLTWTSEKEEGTNVGKKSICSIITDTINREAYCEITPINEYVKHTLKAFVRHLIEHELQSSNSRIFEVGNETEDVTVKIKSEEYRIVKYESGTVRVFNINSQEEVKPTKSILIKINKEKKLGIKVKGNNTRRIGSNVIQKLNKNVKK